MLSCPERRPFILIANGVLQQEASERGDGDPIALLGVEDFRPAPPRQGLLDRFKADPAG
jgi:hypothetical protein